VVCHRMAATGTKAERRTFIAGRFGGGAVVDTCGYRVRIRIYNIRKDLLARLCKEQNDVNDKYEGKRSHGSYLILFSRYLPMVARMSDTQIDE